MKYTAVFVTVLLFGLATARPNLHKKTMDCSGFPKELSGRIYVTARPAQGPGVNSDMQFNMDFNLQRLQSEVTVSGQGTYNTILDYKAGKTYIVYPGGCYTTPLNEPFPTTEFLKDAIFMARGSLGQQGPAVEIYEIKPEEGSVVVVTFESGGQCIPLNFATIEKDGSASTGSFFNLKPTADPEKLKIPEECKQQIDRRFISAMVHTRDTKKELGKILKRGIPWVFPSKMAVKRGLPWVVPG